MDTEFQAYLEQKKKCILNGTCHRSVDGMPEACCPMEVDQRHQVADCTFNNCMEIQRKAKE